MEIGGRTNDKENEKNIYRRIEDDRFESLINSYIYHLTTQKITQCKLGIMKDFNTKLKEVENLQNSNAKLIVDIVSAYMIQQVEEFLAATEEEVEVILNSCRDVDKIFSNFSDFLFTNLKRVLLSDNLIVDVHEFKMLIGKFSGKLEVLLEVHKGKFEKNLEFHQKSFELFDLMKQEFDLTKGIIDELESTGLLNQILEFKNQKTEDRVKDLIESILT